MAHLPTRSHRLVQMSDSFGRTRVSLMMLCLYRLRSCMRHAAAIVVLALLPCAGAVAAPPLALQLVVSGFVNPVGLVNAGDGSKRLFIVEQGGTIRIYSGGQVLATPFLNITSKVTCCGERGLLGLVFDANYATNGFFHVF